MHPEELGGDVNSPFVMGMRGVVREQEAGNTTREKLEEEYLALLDVAESPKQQGLLYAHIVWLYSSHGINQPDVVETYCQETLTCPVRLDVALWMYRWWMMALDARYRDDWRGIRYAVARRRIVVPRFGALKLLLDNGAQKELPPDPYEPLFRELSGTTGAEREQVLEKIRELAEVQPRDPQRDHKLDLMRDRKRFMASIIDLYFQPPAAPEELKALAAKELADYPEALQDLLEQLQAKVEAEDKPD